MGYDVTYHPLRESEVHTCFFDLRLDPQLRSAMYDRFGLTEDEQQDLNQLLDSHCEEDDFNTGDGIFLAAVAGFLRKYWYLRGAAFSFLFDTFPEYARYCRSWRELVPSPYHDTCQDGLSANYMVGCYISEAGAVALARDLDSRPEVQAHMAELFSHGRLAVFRKALDYAIGQQCGLIEVTDLLQPNPLDLEQSSFGTKADNCEMAGVALYVSAAIEQISEAMTQAPPTQKTSFLEKLKSWFS